MDAVLLKAVTSDGGCKGCIFDSPNNQEFCDSAYGLTCQQEDRNDGRSVIWIIDEIF